MVLITRNLITLGLMWALFAFVPANGVASVVDDPQYYVRAQVVEVAPVKGGLQSIRFMIIELVESQEKYGADYSPDALPEEISTKKPNTVHITPKPGRSVKSDDIIAVGVIHGSSMGENGPVPWVMFAHPYYEDGTPIGLHYGERE